MRKFILYISAILLIGCTGPTNSQDKKSIVKEEVNITLYNYSEFQMNYDGQSATIEKTLKCNHEVILVKWRPDSVFLVSPEATRGYSVKNQIDSGVYLLTDGTNIPTVLHIYRVNGKLVIFFQTSDRIVRVTEERNAPCDTL